MKMPGSRRWLVSLLVFAFFSTFAATADGPRERLLMDFGWKFHLGNEWGIAQNLAKAVTGKRSGQPGVQRFQLADREPAA